MISIFTTLLSVFPVCFPLFTEQTDLPVIFKAFHVKSQANLIRTNFFGYKPYTGGFR